MFRKDSLMDASVLEVVIIVFSWFSSFPSARPLHAARAASR
jgi:hypothetical protein